MLLLSFCFVFRFVFVGLGGPGGGFGGPGGGSRTVKSGGKPRLLPALQLLLLLGAMLRATVSVKII